MRAWQNANHRRAMNKPQTGRQDGLGGLGWLVLVGVLLYGLVSLLTWPFRQALRHLPGRREKLLRARVNEMREAIPSAQQLVKVLAAGAHELEAKMDKKMRNMEKDLDRLIATEGWPEDIASDDPWSMAMDILEGAERVGGIDHNASPDELKKEIAPLLRRCGISLDWTFLRELERTKDWNSLKNENLLPVVASRLAASGYVLAHIDDGSDSYNFAPCTPDEFSRIESLTWGGYAIRRFEERQSVG
jgi:hypothetical protein